MKVIFTEADGSSKIDDIKEVKDGYARHLIHFEKALIATPELIADAETRMAEKIKKIKEIQKQAKEVAKEIEKKGIILEFTEKADGIHLYGSITEVMIAEAFTKAAKVEIKKDQVRIGEHLKETGEHNIKIHLVDGVNVKIKVNVIASEDSVNQVKAEKTAKKNETKKDEKIEEVKESK